MRTASQVFYLAVFSLLGSSHATGDLKPSPAKSSPPSNVCEVSNGSKSCASSSESDAQSSESQSPKHNLQFEPGALVTDACASYDTLEQLNSAVHPYLHAIATGTDFFSHYRLNLFNKKCPFWDDENATCGNVACAVNTLDDEKDIPAAWRAAKLGALEGKTAEHPGRKQQREHKSRPLEGKLGEKVDESCVVEYDDECDDRDYCIPEDEGASAKGDYVSLVANPERYTGYAGAGAQQVWQAIYRENCFSKPPKESVSTMQSPPFGSFGNEQQFQAANQLRNVMKQQGVQQNIKNAIAHNQPSARLDPVELDDTCLEKRVFHRVISGMHASITTHLCWDYLNKTSGKWEPNLQCFKERLAPFPDRVSNIYFNYALVMRAVGKIKKHVEHYSFCSQDPTEDKRTRDMVVRLSSAIPSGPGIFDETVMFQDPGSALLKEDFRNRFRNVSRIMDCVGCDKCRLWGKVQTAGYGTALKVLFEFDEMDPSKDPPLRRTELVALINTMDRLSHSLEAIKKFRAMVDEEEGKTAPQKELDWITQEDVIHAQHVLRQEEDGEKKQQAEKAGEGEGKKHPDFKRDWDPNQLSIWENMKEEFNLVMRVYIYVLRSWAALPKKLFNIAVMELARFWNYYVGLRVPERSWEIRIPRHDEM